MQARYSRSLFLLVFLNLLIKPFWLLGIDRNVQLAVGISNYGLYNTLFSLAFIFSIILDPGLHTFSNTSIAQSNKLFPKFFSGFIPLKLGLSIIYIIATMVAGISLGHSLQALYLLFLLSLSQVLASFMLYLRANLSGLHLFSTDSIFSVLDRVLMIIIVGFLLWSGFTGKFRIEWFIYAQLAAFSLSIIAAFPVLLKHAGQKFRPGIKFSFLFIVLRKSFPYTLLTILMLLYTRIDVIMIERLLPDGKYQAGLYAAAYRILEAFTMIAYLFATILLPVFAGMIKRKENINEVTGTYSRILLIPAFLVAVSCFTFRNEIMYLLYPSYPTAYSGLIFGAIMITFISYCASYIFGTLLTANGSLRFLNTISAAGVLLNIALNVVLIKYYYALGAVIATLITQFFVSILQISKSRKIFKLKISSRDIISSVIFVAVACFSFQMSEQVPLFWIYKLIILSVINLIFAFTIGLLKINFFINILKLKE